MQNPKISIIVPVYNVGEYLTSCIPSIQNQTLPDWELILVNDGSTDNSGEICDTYAKQDSRIQVIHKKNEGVSIARNTGIALAKGEYLGFVDGDDTVLPEMYERLYTEAQHTNADIVMCDALTVYPNKNTEPDTIMQLPENIVLEKTALTPRLLKELAGSAWRCIYHRTLFRHSDARFPASLKFSEDRVFNLYMMGYANKISYLKEPFYLRLMQENSCVHRFHPDYFESAKYAADCTATALNQVWDNQQDYQLAFFEQFVGASIAAINNYFYQTCPWTLKQKYTAVKNLCNDTQLQQALIQNPCGGIRGRWIKNKRVLLLCLVAIILNKKYGR